ncbi:MAG TPA: hypothetical protein VHH73_05640, partial [Verrucomicrobiae bacterium]|nr:hypothetical protein [Verrucomicrobiae bacterium]
QAVNQMDSVTQSNAASAEESAGASEELNVQAESMRHAVAELLQLVGAGAKAPVKQAARATGPVTKLRTGGGANGNGNGHVHIVKTNVKTNGNGKHESDELTLAMSSTGNEAHDEKGLESSFRNF